jgi:hypothetical protein
MRTSSLKHSKGGLIFDMCLDASSLHCLVNLLALIGTDFEFNSKAYQVVGHPEVRIVQF